MDTKGKCLFLRFFLLVCCNKVRGSFILKNGTNKGNYDIKRIYVCNVWVTDILSVLRPGR